MLKINAHIPTQQYGFIELTDLPDDVSEVEKLYNKYAEQPIKLNTELQNRVKLTDFFGNTIFYDEASHTYTNEEGEVYLSGSQYAESFRKPFDKQTISSAMAKKAGVSAEEILKMWELKAEVSRDYGNAIHKALQLYEQFGGLSEALNKTTHLHDHPLLKIAVESFYVSHKGEKALSELLITAPKLKKAGRADRVQITGDKRCRIQDFKTNAEIAKDLEFYWKQLEFYQSIFEANGWTVDGLDIYHYNGEWKVYTQGIVEEGPPPKVQADLNRVKALKETK